MSGVDVLTSIGGAITLLETFPVWGPGLALVAAVLLVQAVRSTWGADPEDTGGDTVPPVPETVPAVEDMREDTVTSRAVTCGDTVPEVSPEVETGGPP